MDVNIFKSLRLAMLFYSWMLNNNRSAFLMFELDRRVVLEMHVISDVKRTEEGEYTSLLYTKTLFLNDTLQDLHTTNSILIFDPTYSDLHMQFSLSRTIKSPIIVMTRATEGFREDEVIKSILDVNSHKHLCIFVMNEKNSILCRRIIWDQKYMSVRLVIVRRPTIIMLAIVYTCLLLLVLTTLTIGYIFVAIYSEKDPVCLPGTLERCLVTKYAMIPSRDLCQKCMICLEDFVKSDVCRVLGCTHFFHANCVDPWLKDKSSRCPLCSQHLNANINS
eukprot:jgi/Antlo1/1979/151